MRYRAARYARGSGQSRGLGLGPRPQVVVDYSPAASALGSRRRRHSAAPRVGVLPLQALGAAAALPASAARRAFRREEATTSPLRRFSAAPSFVVGEYRLASGSVLRCLFFAL